MPFETATVPTEDSFEAGYQKLFRAFRRFATGAATPGTPSYTGTGDGQLVLFDTKPNAPTETWTLTAVNATTFDVTGSVSGAQAQLTVDTNYENGFIAARIEAGATPFVASDEFTVGVTVGALSGTNNQWLIDRYDYFDSTHELIFHGQGLAGTDEVYVGIRLQEDAGAQEFIWEVRGFTGFSNPDPFASQPGVSPASYTSFWNQDMEYWFVVNGRRFVVVAQISTSYHALYGGFILPFATPQEFPYPLFAGGEDDVVRAYTSTDSDFSHFVDPINGGAQFRDVNGTWLEGNQGLFSPTTAFSVWPWNSNAGSWLADMQNMPSGDFVLFPATVYGLYTSVSDPLSGTLHGELDGVFAVTGFNNAVENLINIGGTDYLVVQNIFRTTRDAFWALRLD